MQQTGGLERGTNRSNCENLPAPSRGRAVAGVNRREDLDRFYRIIATLREKCQGFRCLKECTRGSGWPERGVYFFFEDHESREDASTLRVARVGTHAVSANARTTLWNRLHAHKGTSSGGGNHRGSIFRKRVGEALLQVRSYSPEIAV